MSLYFIAIGLAIGANVAYHLCTKKVDGAINPFLSLAVTYLTAFIASAALVPFAGLTGGWAAQWSRVNWASYGLGLSIVFLEFGFILAYRTGWTLSTAALYANVAVGLILLPIGILYFAEALAWRQLLGIAFALLGLVLMSK